MQRTNQGSCSLVLHFLEVRTRIQENKCCALACYLGLSRLFSISPAFKERGFGERQFPTGTSRAEVINNLLEKLCSREQVSHANPPPLTTFVLFQAASEPSLSRGQNYVPCQPAEAAVPHLHPVLNRNSNNSDRQLSF